MSNDKILIILKKGYTLLDIKHAHPCFVNCLQYFSVNYVG